MKDWHSWHVARRSGHFWLGLFHDAVEDGYLPRFILRWWPSLDAITRREGEVYRDYIDRLSADDAARAVKVTDLCHNLMRNGGCGPSLRKRYLSALAQLSR